jgi:ABC-2 type transport system permease protein
VDLDQSTTSRRLVEKLQASSYFLVVETAFSAAQADDALLRRKARLVLHIPHGFERDLQRSGTVQIQMVFDAQDGATAGVTQAYANSILAAFNRDIQVDFLSRAAGATQTPAIEIVPAHWYNPDLDYQTFMVPGILVLLVTMIGTFLSAMNVVREKEIGTIEQLNVTPIRKYQFVVGKLLPFLVIALFELAFGLVIAWIVFRIPMIGNLALVFALATVYLLAMLGLGLLISTVTETQQQAMFIAWFVMVIFILMSGLFTPIESMPAWAQKLTLLNPVAYFITIMRRVLLKGAGFGAVQFEFWALAAYATAMLMLALRRYRKVSA